MSKPLNCSWSWRRSSAPSSWFFTGFIGSRTPVGLDGVSRGLRAVIRLESGGFRPAVTHKSDPGPVHSVQVRPASLAEWQKQVRIGILGQIRREFSEIEARLQGDLDDPSDHSVAEVD